MIANTGYWTFFSRPGSWDIDSFLSSGESPEGDHTVKPRKATEFKEGQLGLLRVLIDKRTVADRNGAPKSSPGVYAIVQITGAAAIVPPFAPQWFASGSRYAEDQLRVRLTVIRNFKSAPIPLSELETVGDAPLLKPREGVACAPLQEEAFLKLCDRWGGGGDSIAREVAKTEAPTNWATIQKWERRYADAAPLVKQALSRRIERGPIGIWVKSFCKHRCCVCEAQHLNPFSFLTSSGNPYAEVHHVMPVSTGVAGALTASNCIVLCANHHRQAHYGVGSIRTDGPTRFVFDFDGKSVEISRTVVPSESS
jgi:hypothetical protein